jgi:hypothetical protein
MGGRKMPNTGAFSLDAKKQLRPGLSLVFLPQTVRGSVATRPGRGKAALEAHPALSCGEPSSASQESNREGSGHGECDNFPCSPHSTVAAAPSLAFLGEMAQVSRCWQHRFSGLRRFPRPLCSRRRCPHPVTYFCARWLAVGAGGGRAWLLLLLCQVPIAPSPFAPHSLPDLSSLLTCLSAFFG